MWSIRPKNFCAPSARTVARSSAPCAERVHDAVDTAKTRLSDLEEQATGATRRATSSAESFIRDNPWTTVGVAVGVGLLLGALLSRSASE